MRQARLILLLAGLAACAPASSYRPSVDPAGVDAARYETDLRDCTRAAERDRYAPLLVGFLQGAALGTAMGAALGGVIVQGNVGLAESYGAVSGAVAGPAVAAATIPPAPKPSEQEQIRDCLRANGYKIAG
jgi:outer membrane lipoprotein SlyB